VFDRSRTVPFRDAKAPPLDRAFDRDRAESDGAIYGRIDQITGLPHAKVQRVEKSRLADPFFFSTCSVA